eukprot:3524654-Alexandrium_andersonii.AAC.1
MRALSPRSAGDRARGADAPVHALRSTVRGCIPGGRAVKTRTFAEWPLDPAREFIHMEAPGETLHSCRSGAC